MRTRAPKDHLPCRPYLDAPTTVRSIQSESVHGMARALEARSRPMLVVAGAPFTAAAPKGGVGGGSARRRASRLSVCTPRAFAAQALGVLASGGH